MSGIIKGLVSKWGWIERGVLLRYTRLIYYSANVPVNICFPLKGRDAIFLIIIVTILNGLLGSGFGIHTRLQINRSSVR